MINKIKILIFSALLVMALLPSIAAAQQDKFYQLDLFYDNGAIQLKNITVLPGSISRTTQEGDYEIKLSAFSNNILYTSSFSIPLSIRGEEFDLATGTFASKAIQSDKLNFTLNVPYSSSGKTINIYYPNSTKVLKIDVGYFAQTCPDKICQPHESYESCSKDCKSGGKDDFCDAVKDRICDPDCLPTQDSDCVTPQRFKRINLRPYLIVGIAVAAFGLTAFIYWRIKRRKRIEE